MHHSTVLTYCIVILSIIMLLDSVRFALKIMKKSLNEKIFLIMIVVTNPIALFILYGIDKYTSLLPAGYNFTFAELEYAALAMELIVLMSNLGKRFFHEYVLDPFSLIVLLGALPICEYVDPKVTICMWLRIIFYLLSIAYIILIWYHNYKNERNCVANGKVDEKD